MRTVVTDYRSITRSPAIDPVVTFNSPPEVAAAAPRPGVARPFRNDAVRVRMDETPIPPGLRRARRVATLLDDAVTIPVINRKIGLDPLVGLLPVSGDVATAVLSLYIVAEAVRSGVPRAVVARMLLNVILDTAVGSVPVVGDVFDVFWKANRRNVRLFERAVGVAD
jgi:hypothetical protein